MHGLFKDLSGQTFGRLLALWANKGKRRAHLWSCQCDCGTVVLVSVDLLKNGKTKSCGCLVAEGNKERGKSQVTHGQATIRLGVTPEYRAWSSAKQRCTNPNTINYENYGGRGIQFKFGSFEEFYRELGNKPEPKHFYSIDRYPDNDGHYEVGNVRWATAKQQRNNRRQVAAC